MEPEFLTPSRCSLQLHPGIIFSSGYGFSTPDYLKLYEVIRIYNPDFYKFLIYSPYMGASYQISDQDQAYFLTFQVVGWADIFSRKIYRDIIIDSFD